MIANSFVSANCKASNCESSIFRSFAFGQESGSKTVTRVLCFEVELVIKLSKRKVICTQLMQ